MNAVESLLTRLQISDAIPAFRAMKIQRIVQLRSLPEDKMREAVPDEEQRRTLVNAIVNRGTPGNAASATHTENPPRYGEDDGSRNFEGGRGRGGRGGRGGYSAGRGRSTEGPSADSEQQPRRACRQFFTEQGCGFGDKCKYLHDGEEFKRQSAGGQPRSNDNIGRDSHQETVDVPTDGIKFLLGDDAARLRRINMMCGTTNSKIEKLATFSETYPIVFYGTAEAVARAKLELQKAVGLKRLEDQRARFEYAKNELAHNQRSATLLAVANARSAAKGNGLSEDILKRVIQTFRFEPAHQIRHFSMLGGQTDKEKLEAVAKIASQLKGIQAIVFAEPNRVEEMSKAPGPARISRAFNGAKPLFVHRNLSKEARMEALEAFKNGEENEHGVKQRLLITTIDYAKLARKTVIPYVNLIVNLSMPRSEEFFILQSQCAGRHGTQGASLTFVTVYDNSVHKEWQQIISFEEFRDEKSFFTTASQLAYDTKANPLTPANAEPPANWRELLKEEAAAKAAAKAAKA